MIQSLPIDQIVTRSDARAVDPEAVTRLVDSIAEVGLINPVRVRAAGDHWEVIAGVHRVEAHKRLGLAEIAAEVVEDDDLHAELAMIDENLCRSELSPSDRARQTARRKAIYLELHPETSREATLKHGDQAPSRQLGETEKAERFTSDTAKATGQSERTIQRDAERGEKVIDEVLDLIRGTKLDTGTYLDKLKKLSPNDQVAAAKRDLAALRQASKVAPARSATSKIDNDVKMRAAREVADILAEYVPGEWWDAVKANLYAAGAANIANEFTNITGQSIMDRVA